MEQLVQTDFLHTLEVTVSSEKLIKSKARVQAHGEVFTPDWMVEKMLDLVADEAADIYKTFLEPSSGDGNFLLTILKRKLAAVETSFDKKYWKTKSLFALVSIYGIEYLGDNLSLARDRMLGAYITWFEKKIQQPITNDSYKAARYIIWHNIVRGNTLTKKNPETDEPIIFNEYKRVKASPSKVEVSEFTFASLFGEKLASGVVENQLSLFDLDGDGIEDILIDEPIPESTVIDILKIYKLEGQ